MFWPIIILLFSIPMHEHTRDAPNLTGQSSGGSGNAARRLHRFARREALASAVALALGQALPESGRVAMIFQACCCRTKRQGRRFGTCNRPLLLGFDPHIGILPGSQYAGERPPTN